MKGSAALCLLAFLAVTAVPVSVGNSSDPELQQIAAYRQWERLTKSPIAVDVGAVAG